MTNQQIIVPNSEHVHKNLQGLEHLVKNENNRLYGQSYKLSGAASQFGMDIAFPDTIECNEREMSIVIPIADGNRRDGVGDLLEIGGIRTDRHRQNPISLFDHGKKVELPIGMAAVWDEDLNRYDFSQYTYSADTITQTAKIKTFFYRGKGLDSVERKTEYDHAVFCEQLFDMAVKRLVQAGSIGYQVISARELPPDYEKGTPKGLHLLSILMLEGSLVVMPANQDTVMKMLSMPSCCGKPLSPYLIKSLEPYAAEPKATMLVHQEKSILPINTKEESEVPLESVRGPNTVPPPNWKPGAGAIKKIRQEIRQKMHRSKSLNWKPDPNWDNDLTCPEGYAIFPGRGCFRLIDMKRGMVNIGEYQTEEETKRAAEIFADTNDWKGYLDLVKRMLKTTGCAVAGGTIALHNFIMSEYKRGVDARKAAEDIASKGGCKSLRGNKTKAITSWNKTGNKWSCNILQDEGYWNQKVPVVIRLDRNGMWGLWVGEDFDTFYNTPQEAMRAVEREYKSLRRMKTKGIVRELGHWLSPGAKSPVKLAVIENGGDFRVAFINERGTEESSIGPYNTKEDAIREAMAEVKDEGMKQVPMMYRSNGQKSLTELRKQYRPIKGLRRRLRKSVPGSSLVFVARKDLKEVEEIAEGTGLKFHHLGSLRKGVEKVKLSGQDESIDEVAKAFGMPIRGMRGRKSLSYSIKAQCKPGQNPGRDKCTKKPNPNTKVKPVEGTRGRVYNQRTIDKLIAEKLKRDKKPVATKPKEPVVSSKPKIPNPNTAGDENALANVRGHRVSYVAGGGERSGFQVHDAYNNPLTEIYATQQEADEAVRPMVARWRKLAFGKSMRNKTKSAVSDEQLDWIDEFEAIVHKTDPELLKAMDEDEIQQKWSERKSPQAAATEILRGFRNLNAKSLKVKTKAAPVEDDMVEEISTVVGTSPIEVLENGRVVIWKCDKKLWENIRSTVNSITNKYPGGTFWTCSSGKLTISKMRGGSRRKSLKVKTKMDPPIASVKIKYDKEWQEWQVWAYDANGKRIPNSDHHADSKEDAEGTAKLMLRPKKSLKVKNKSLNSAYADGFENGRLVWKYRESDDETLPNDRDWENATVDDYSPEEMKEFIRGCKDGWRREGGKSLKVRTKGYVLERGDILLGKDGKKNEWYVINDETEEVVDGPFRNSSEAEKVLIRLEQLEEGKSLKARRKNLNFDTWMTQVRSALGVFPQGDMLNRMTERLYDLWEQGKSPREAADLATKFVMGSKSLQRFIKSQEIDVRNSRLSAEHFADELEEDGYRVFAVVPEKEKGNPTGNWLIYWDPMQQTVWGPKENGVRQVIAGPNPRPYKSLRSTKGKNMRREIKSGDDLPNVMDDKELDIDQLLVDEDTGETDEKDINEETHGAQALRRMHEDHKALLQDYHDMHKMVEKEPVKDHLFKFLKGLDESMSDTEDLWGEHYEKDLGPLDPDADLADEDEKGLDEDEELDDELPDEEEKDFEDVDEADSDPDEQVDPEEALQGMQKSLSPWQLKRLRLRIRRKAMDEDEESEDDELKSLVRRRKDINVEVEDEEDEPEDLGVKLLRRRLKALEDDESEEAEEEKSLIHRKLLRRRVKHVCSECKEEGKTECECGGKSLRRRRKDIDDADAVEFEDDFEGKDFNEEDEGTFTDDMGQEIASPGMKSLDDDEKATVAEASGFAKELSEANDLTNEHRMKSFYHHKALKDISFTDEIEGQDQVNEGGITTKSYTTTIRQVLSHSWPINSAEAKNLLGMGAWPTSGKAFDDLESVALNQTAEGKEPETEIKAVEETDEEGNKKFLVKSVVGSPEWEAEEEMEPEHQKSLHPHRKSCAMASKFFKDMSEEQAFGDKHREKALTWHKALDNIAMSEDEDEEMKALDEEDYDVKDDDEIYEPGEMGEKDMDVEIEDDETEDDTKSLIDFKDIDLEVEDEEEESPEMLKALRRRRKAIDVEIEDEEDEMPVKRLRRRVKSTEEEEEHPLDQQVAKGMAKSLVKQNQQLDDVAKRLEGVINRM